jgi:hypothetical protein
MPRKAVSKDTVPMMDVSKDTTNQAMSKMIVKLTNYKEESTASTKPVSIPAAVPGLELNFQVK